MDGPGVIFQGCSTQVTPKSSDDHGCQPSGLESPLSRESSTRQEVAIGNSTQHQLSGTESHMPGPLGSEGRPLEQACPDTDGQCNGKGLHKQAGWGQMLKIRPRSQCTDKIDRKQYFVGCSCSGTQQYPGRLTELTTNISQSRNWKDMFLQICDRFSTLGVDLFATNQNTQ